MCNCLIPSAKGRTETVFGKQVQFVPQSERWKMENSVAYNSIADC